MSPQFMRARLVAVAAVWTLFSVHPGAAASLSGSFATPSGTQNLTAQGTADWAHWGTISSISFDHKASGGSQISNFTVVNGEIGHTANFDGNPFAYSWSGGAPTANATTATGVYINGASRGFQFTAPADTTSRTITVYVGAYATQARMVAHLSDGSASDFIDTTLASVGSLTRVYTLSYQAAAAGQTLSITFTNAGGGGNVNLQAATLTAGPSDPDFTISAAPAGQSVTVGNNTSYTVTTTAVNGFSGSIALAVTGGLPASTTAVFAPTSISGSGSSTLTITTTGGTPPGAAGLTVTGTSGVLSHNAPAALTVNAAPVPDFTISAGPPNQAVTVGNSTAYTVTTTAANGFSGVVDLAVSSGLPGGATASFVPATLTGSGSSTLTINTTPGTPTGGVTLTITGTSLALAHNTPAGLTVTPVSGPSNLSGSFATPSGVQNLTALGTADWAHWGITSSLSFDHKASGATQISPYSVVNGDISQVANFGGNPFAYAWSDGAPTGSANTATGIYINGSTRGFRFTAPADTTPRTLTVYVGIYATQGRMVAHLSDNSAADYVDTSLSSAGSVPRSYTFTYQAASAGQTLVITFTNAGGGGNVNLQAAALTAGPVVPPSPDFTISTAAPTSQSVTVGNNTTYTVTTTALNGFGGSINLSVSNGLPGGTTAVFAPTSITGSGSSTLTISTTGGTPTGAATLTILGTNASLNHTTQAGLTVSPAPVPDFTISAGPPSQTVIVGNNTTYTITTTAVNSFNGSIDLSVNSGLPSGATASFIPPAVTAGATSTLTITTTAGTTTGAASLSIKGISGTLNHSTPASLIVNPVPVPDFTISAGPANQNVTVGNSTTYTVTATAVNGFSSSIDLTLASGLPSGATATFVPPTITGSGTSTLTITTLAATPTGPAVLSVTGASGVLNHSSPVTLTVAPAGGVPLLTGSFVTPSGTYNLTNLGIVDWAQWGLISTPIRKASGGSKISDYTVVNGEAGSVSTYNAFPVTFSWSDGTPYASANSATGVYINNTNRGFALTVPADTSSRIFTVFLGVYATQAQVVAHLSDNSAPDFTDASFSSGGSVSRAYTFNYQAASAGQTLTVTFKNIGGGGNVSLQAAYLAQKDFTISVAPASRTVTAGNDVNYTVTTTAINGFTGNIALSASGLPPGSSASFSPSSIAGAGSSTMTVSTTGPTPGGAYPLTITGTNAALVRSTSASLNVNGVPQPDFIISVVPGTQTVTAGTNTTFTVSTTAQNGFAGVITLSASGFPSGATASFAPPTITGAGSSVMTVTTTAGTLSNGYSLTVTGTSSPLVRTGQGSLIVYPPVGSNPPGLSGAYFIPSGTQNLSTLGTADWAHWGLANASSFDHKTSGGSQISNITALGVGPNSVFRHEDSSFNQSWSDGLPTASASTPTGVYVRGINAAFQLTVPADSTRRILILYLGMFNAGAHITGHLSDGSAPDFAADWSGQGSRAYTFVYSSSSPGQTLTITFTQTAILNPNNNITIQGAALSVVSPSSDFILSSSPASQSIAPGGTVTYNLTVAPTSGFGGIVAFSAAGWPSNTTVSFNPPALIGSGNVLMTVTTTALTLPGTYVASVTASAQGIDHPATFGLNILGGTSPYLGGASFTPVGTVNLTTTGTRDWAHWGLDVSSTFNHKSGVTQQIQTFTVVNGELGKVAVSDTTTAVSWSDGTPYFSGNTNRGVVITGLNLGFQVTAPADTLQRTFILYAGVFNTRGKLVAHLSDGSSPDYVDTVFSSEGAIPAAYIITYKAASAGQTLTVQWTMNENTGPRCAELSGIHCLVTLNAAALSVP